MGREGMRGGRERVFSFPLPLLLFFSISSFFWWIWEAGERASLLKIPFSPQSTATAANAAIAITAGLVSRTIGELEASG